MISTALSASLVSSAVILLAAYIYFPYWNNQVDLNVVLNGLLKAEAMVHVNPETRIAVGFGSCLDVVGSGLHVLEKLGDLVPDIPENFKEIHNMNELMKTFAYFFMHGASAGRVTKNETLFEEMLAVMKDLPDTKFTVGGNAPVMTKRFGKEDTKVLLAAAVPADQMKEFASSVSVVHGLAPGNDIHLVLEYERDAVWGKYVSKRANRFILYNKSENNFSSLLDEFSLQQEIFQPQVLVVGGLRMMLNFKEGDGMTALDELKSLLSKSSGSKKIHLEMSSFSDRAQFQTIIENAVFYADSMGMNEQELPNLFRYLSGSEMMQVSDSHPRIAVTLDYMRSVFRILQNTEETNGRRRMSRLHVHTLAYQVIMTGTNSTWRNSMSAVAKAALTANRHTCGSDTINLGTAMLLTDESFALSPNESSRRIWFDPTNPVSCWTEGNIDVCLAPVLVCTRVLQTVGGGDNVSAAGLVLQI